MYFPIKYLLLLDWSKQKQMTVAYNNNNNNCLIVFTEWFSMHKHNNIIKLNKRATSAINQKYINKTEL